MKVLDSKHSRAHVYHAHFWYMCRYTCTQLSRCVRPSVCLAVSVWVSISSCVCCMQARSWHACMHACLHACTYFHLHPCFLEMSTVWNETRLWDVCEVCDRHSLCLCTVHNMCNVCHLRDVCNMQSMYVMDAGTPACMCPFMYVCMHVCMYVCMYVRMYVCTYVRMYVCMYVCMYVSMYVGRGVCAHV